MKKALIFFLILVAIGVCQWMNAEGKCCPPPPATTGPQRTLPRSSRTDNPSTDITLPPTTNGTVTSQPGLSTLTGPVTASSGGTATRTLASGVTNMTSNPSGWVNTSASGGGRPSASNRTNNNTQTQPSGSGANTTSIPSLSLIGPKDPNSPIIVEEFGWEEYWNENIGHLLAEYEPQEEDKYSVTRITKEDIPALVSILTYKGIFDRGIHKVVSENIASMQPDELISVLGPMSQEKFKFNQKYMYHGFDKEKKDYANAAIMALGYMKDAKAADKVAAVLFRNLNSSSRAAIADTSEDLLKNTFKKGSNENMYWACFALGRIGNPEYIPVLTEVLLKGKDRYIQAAAAEAIAMIGGSAASDALTENFDKARKYYQVQTYVAGSIGFVGASDPVDDILAGLESKVGDVRAASTWALAHIINSRIVANKPYKDLLNQYDVSLKSESDDIVLRAKALSFLLYPSVKLMSLYQTYIKSTRDPGVRAYSALAMGYTGSPSCVEFLSTQKADSDPLVEKAIGYAMAMLMTGDNSKVSLDIFEAHSDDVKDETLLAAGILGVGRYMDEEESFKLVNKHKSHKGESQIVLRATSFAFARFHGKKGESITTKNVKAKDTEKSAFALVGSGIRNTVEALKAIDAGKQKNPDMKIVEGVARGLMGGLSLVQALKDKTGNRIKEHTRAAALVALGALNRPEEINFILEKVQKENSSYKVRAYALAGLANVTVPKEQEETVIAALCKIAKEDRAYMVRAYACFALTKFPESREAYETVAKGTEDQEKDGAAMAAIALGMFKNPNALKEINAVIQRGRGTPLAYAGYIALGMMGDRTNLDNIISAFEMGSNVEEIVAMAFAIARSAEKNTYEDMLKYLKNPDLYIREGAVKALAMMDNLTEDGKTEVINNLKTLEEDDDKCIAFLAATTRYSFGDRKAIRAILDTVTHRDFTFAGRAEMHDDHLMNVINDAMPLFFKMKPYYWSDND